MPEIKNFEKLEQKVKIDPEILDEAEILAQIVGGDFGMKVKIGKPGHGSFHNPETATITLDPVQFIKEDNPKLKEMIRESTEKKIPIAEIFPKYFPEIKKEDLDMDELIFLLGHEGGHRAITRGPNEIGLKKEKIDELARKIGFFYGNNAVEDPADNNWVRNKFPKIGESMKKIYDEQTKHENVPAGIEHPDIQRAIALLGYIPRFAWFGAEVIRYWWKKQFSRGLRPEIKKALENVKNYLPKIFNSIPPERKTERETIEKARERFLQYYEKVWPELEKLVKMDIDDEKINQMIEKMEDEIAQQLEEELKRELEEHRKRKEQRQKSQKLEQQKQELEKQNQEIDKQIKDLKKKMESASSQQKRELEKQIQEKQEQKEKNQQKQKDIEKQQKEIQEQEQRQKENQMQSQCDKCQAKGQNLQKQIEDLKKKAQNASGQEKQDLEKQIQQKQAEKQANDQELKDLQQKLEQQKEQRQKSQKLEQQKQELNKQNQELDKQIEDLKKKAQNASGQEKKDLEKQIQEKQEQKTRNQQKQKEIEKQQKEMREEKQKYPSSPLEDLSPRLKKKLEEIYNNLSEEEKKELEEMAKEKLEDLEDKLNDKLEGKLNKDNPKSHKEIREEERKKRERKKEIEKAEREKEKLEEAYKKAKKEFEKKLEEEMTEYEKAYSEVKPIIEKLYQKLKKIFEPLEGEWEEGYAAGQRISLRKAMQAKARPELKTKIWEKRRKPEELKYRFILLIDTSGSMKGEEMEETFKGLVVLIEVLNKLDIPVEVIAFSTHIKKFKDFKKKLNKDLRNKLSQIKSYEGGWTHTDEATIYAWEEIKKQMKENENVFLITLTDGVPEPDTSNRLQRLKKTIKDLEIKGIKQIGIGLGPDTEFVKEIYSANLYLPKIKPTESERKKGVKGFDEEMAKLLEQIICHPEKFTSKKTDNAEHLIK